MIENISGTKSDFGFSAHVSYHPDPYQSGHRPYDGNMENLKKDKQNVFRDFNNEVKPIGKQQSRMHHSLRTSVNFEDEMLCRNAKFYCNDEKKVDMRIVDRSFTNLGYIGYGEGINFDTLDQTGNWQFDEFID